MLLKVHSTQLGTEEILMMVTIWYSIMSQSSNKCLLKNLLEVQMHTAYNQCSVSHKMMEN